MIEALWAIYVTACFDTTCVSQEIQRFDTQLQCIEILPAYKDISLEGDWSSVTWECKLLKSTDT